MKKEHEHGEKGNCHTCYEQGTFDMKEDPKDPKRTYFEDSIWFNNKTTKDWACHYCWLK